ncbi:MAG: hypothetical protein G3M70_06635 [Candidatus Nitronauta litoralis]|uniref:Uncharacterized protein n=1 Tax=Candidatus Nitronauta litoralis TaxID=2705533 RepID=A0A7T0G058_9BACT|nr:MAG: hypothetical protein G3M70_06635 [Candidatus Nitronauta litoralis]
MTCGVVENASRFPTAPTGPTNADLIEDFPKTNVRNFLDTTMKIALMS